MAKYIVNDGSMNIGPFDTKEWAAIALIGAVTNALESGADPTLWHIEEVPDEPEKPKDVPELIPDYEAARKYLGYSDIPDDLLGVTSEVFGQAEAFRDLLTLCKAWNKADGWEPDWKDGIQEKFYPDFMLPMFAVSVSPSDSVAQSPFVFKTIERAEQFGERFIDLFKQLYGIKEGE